MSLSASQSTYETLSIYGFKIDYPSTLKVEFNPKSQHEEGDVAFKPSTSGFRLFLSWGQLRNWIQNLHQFWIMRITALKGSSMAARQAMSPMSASIIFV